MSGMDIDTSTSTTTADPITTSAPMSISTTETTIVPSSSSGVFGLWSGTKGTIGAGNPFASLPPSEPKSSIPTGSTAFMQSSIKVGESLASFYTDFVGSFDKDPNEVGMTDQLMLGLKRFRPSLKLIRNSQSKEALDGADVEIRFEMSNDKLLGTGVTVNGWFQAKCLRGPKRKADFCYMVKSSQVQQMYLLQATIEEARKQGKTTGAVAFGGYILYGPDVTLFVPIGHVISKYEELTKKDKDASVSGKNQDMSDYFMEHAKEYSVSQIINIAKSSSQ